MSNDPQTLVIRGDKSHLWSFTYFWLLTGLALGVVATLFAPGKRVDNAWTLLIFPSLAVAFSGTQCLTWRRRVLPIRYELSPHHLAVFDGEDEVARFAISELLNVQMVGEMSYGAMAGSAGTFLPRWPSLQVAFEQEDSSDPTYRRLPEVMIWGKAGKERANESIRKQLGQQRGPNQ